MFLLQTLQLNQLPVSSFERHQLRMRPTLHHHSPIDDINDVGLLDGAEPVRHRDRRSAPCRGVQGGLDHFLGLRVESTGGFVQ